MNHIRQNFFHGPYFLQKNCTSSINDHFMCCFELCFQAEISLCRVYKRAGVEDHPSLPRILTNRPSSSRGTPSSDNRKQQQAAHQAAAAAAAFGSQSSQQMMEMEKVNETTTTTTDGSSSTTDHVTTTLVLSNPNDAYSSAPAIMVPTLGATLTPVDEDRIMLLHHHSTKQVSSFGNPNCSTSLFSSSSSNLHPTTDDDLHRLVNYQQAQAHAAQASIIHQQQQHYHNHHHSQFSTSILPQSSQPLTLNMLSAGSLPASAFSDRLWDWNQIQEASRDYNNTLFK